MGKSQRRRRRMESIPSSSKRRGVYKKRQESATGLSLVRRERPPDFDWRDLGPVCTCGWCSKMYLLNLSR